MIFLKAAKACVCLIFGIILAILLLPGVILHVVGSIPIMCLREAISDEREVCDGSERD